MDNTRIRELLDKWRTEERALVASINILVKAREILPKGIIDAQLHELISERLRLQSCMIDLQELLLQ